MAPSAAARDAGWWKEPVFSWLRNSAWPLSRGGSAPLAALQLITGLGKEVPRSGGVRRGGKQEGDLTAATAHFTACHALMAEEIKAGMELFIEINQSPRRRGENNIASSVIPAQPRGGCHRRSPGSWTRLVLSLGAAEPPLSPLGCPEQLVGRDEMGATGSRIWGMDVWVPCSGCIASKGSRMRFATCSGP